MKDVLEYTREELEAMSTEDLMKLHFEAQMMEEQKSTGQLTKKVLINSLYGALANKHFPLFNEKIAQSITGNGRFFIQKTANMIERGLQEKLPSNEKYVVYGDTDSVYYQIAPYADLFRDNKLKEMGKKLSDLTSEESTQLLEDVITFDDNFAEKVVQPIIDKSIEEMANDFNAYNPSRIGAKREVIASEGAYFAKKKYTLRVRVDEGTRFPIDNPHLKVMGLELAKSTTPLWVKEKLAESIEVILDKSEVEMREYIRGIKTEYMKQPLSDIAGVIGCKNVSAPLPEEKSIHFGRKMAWKYNTFIQENNLTTSYPEIKAGDKFKYFALLEPNPFNNDNIGYVSDDFAEKYVKPYIDYDTNFEKTYISSLKNMTDPIGFNVDQETESLDDW